MLDYAEPGVLGNFTDERTVERLIKKIAQAPAPSRARRWPGTFDMLRANDLIFNYVVSNWLMGQDPPSFDILAWNADSTRMPAAMHAFYLRNFYVRNKLAAGHAGDRRPHDRPERDQVADLRRQRDQRPHRARGSRRTRPPAWSAGPVRFVLSSGGHIAGIVNPPSPKAWFLAARRATTPRPRSAEAWREHGAAPRPARGGRTGRAGRRESAGDMVDPPRHGQRELPGAR